MTLKTKDIILITMKTNGRCFYCNRRENIEIDHFISRSKWQEWELEEVMPGMLNHLENLFLACVSCNRRKSDQCPEDFIGNSHIAWYRYVKANQRVGLCKEITDPRKFAF